MKETQLLKCCSKVCQHVFTKEEMSERVDDTSCNLRTMICPNCGEESQYILTREGLVSKDTSLRIHPEDIVPSFRLGSRMRREVLNAKKRALKG